MISGINGGNCILSSMAKSRVESNMIDGAEVIGSKGNYVVVFKGSAAEWNEKPVVLSSSRQPYEPRIFKSLDGAIAELNRIGLHEIAVKVTD
ncbi:hypothetical protein [Pseudoalteromonas sp. PAR1]|uniref:hypothetical protein n=1 Tax=Pseudoalteromonas sp. PAR1 TaxID=2853443 RepID=UPI00248B5B3C|nr:hypothetical protein [Pseudoalteromonas sp. PAR1]